MRMIIYFLEHKNIFNKWIKTDLNLFNIGIKPDGVVVDNKKNKESYDVWTTLESSISALCMAREKYKDMVFRMAQSEIK